MKFDVRTVASKADPAWGRHADCCDTPVVVGDVLLANDHRSRGTRLHLGCVERALDAAAQDLVEYPTARAAQLDATGRLPAHRVGARLR